jgi:hypothetical protein
LYIQTIRLISPALTDLHPIMSKEKKAKKSKKPKYRRGGIWTLDPEVYIRQATKRLTKELGLSRIGVVEKAVALLAKIAEENPIEAKRLADEYLLDKARKKAQKEK